MAESPFIASACDTDMMGDGRYVRLAFEPTIGANCKILIPATQFPAMAKIWMKQADQLAPSHQGHSALWSGQSLTVDDLDLAPSATGAFVLSAFVRVFDAEGERGVTLTLPLSPTVAQKLRASLDQHLSSDEPD